MTTLVEANPSLDCIRRELFADLPSTSTLTELTDLSPYKGEKNIEVELDEDVLKSKNRRLSNPPPTITTTTTTTTNTSIEKNNEVEAEEKVLESDAKENIEVKAKEFFFESDAEENIEVKVNKTVLEGDTEENIDVEAKEKVLESDNHPVLPHHPSSTTASTTASKVSTKARHPHHSKKISLQIYVKDENEEGISITREERVETILNKNDLIKRVFEESNQNKKHDPTSKCVTLCSNVEKQDGGIEMNLSIMGDVSTAGTTGRVLVSEEEGSPSSAKENVSCSGGMNLHIKTSCPSITSKSDNVTPKIDNASSAKKKTLKKKKKKSSMITRGRDMFPRSGMVLRARSKSRRRSSSTSGSKDRVH